MTSPTTSMCTRASTTCSTRNRRSATAPTAPTRCRRWAAISTRARGWTSGAGEKTLMASFKGAAAWLLAAPLVLSAVSAAAGAATPFTLDDYYLLETVSEPTFSPAGDRVAYTLSRNDRKSDKATSDLWSVPYGAKRDGRPRQLTRTPKSSEWMPRFGADGKTLYFLGNAGKDEITQLW